MADAIMRRFSYRLRGIEPFLEELRQAGVEALRAVVAAEVIVQVVATVGGGVGVAVDGEGLLGYVSNKAVHISEKFYFLLSCNKTLPDSVSRYFCLGCLGWFG